MGAFACYPLGVLNAANSLLLIICSNLFFFPCTEEQEEFCYSASPELNAARQAYKAGDLRKAYKLTKPLIYKEELTYVPHLKQAMALCSLADCYIKQGRYAEAKRLLDHAHSMIAVAPESWIVAIKLAEMHTQQGNHQEAENHMKSALETCLKNAASTQSDVYKQYAALCQFKLGEAYKAAGDYQKASEAFRDAMLNSIKLGGTLYFKAWANAAYLNAEGGQKELANEAYDRLIAQLTDSHEDAARARVLPAAIRNKMELLRELEPNNTTAVVKLEAELKEADSYAHYFVDHKLGQVDFSKYMANLQRRIKKGWHPPKADKTARVVVVFKVHADGDISDLKVQTSAGEKADEAAVNAVSAASPVEPLPEGSPSQVDIQFTFDYNVFKGGGRWQYFQ